MTKSGGQVTNKIQYCALFVLLALYGCATNDSGSAPPIIFKNVSLIDGVNDDILPSRNVVVDRGVIRNIYAAGEGRPPKNAIIFDLDGATMLPGLINGHIHLTPNKDRESNLREILQNGVTTVRDAGGDARVLRDLSENSSRGDVAFPRIIYAAVLFGEKFMDDPRVQSAARGMAAGNAPWMRLVADADEIEAIVSDARATGAHGLKLYASLDKPAIKGIIEEARRQDMKIWAHSITFPGAPEDIVSAGPDQIIHAKGLAGLNAPDIPDNFAEGVRSWTPEIEFSSIDPRSAPYKNLFAEMVTKNVILEPALIADGDVVMARRPLTPWQQSQRKWACDATKAASAAGVSISAGTDFFGDPGLLFRELARLTECGLSPMQAIQAATITNAKALGIHTETGSIEIGKSADLLVVTGNPIGDITELQNTLIVVKAGAIVRNELPSEVTR